MAPLLVITAVNVFSLPLFVRYLGAEKYALWAYVSMFTGMFGFADLGLGGAVGRYIGVAIGRGDHAAVREYWGTGNVIAIPLLALMAVVFAGIGVVFGPTWFNVAPANTGLLRACFVSGGLSLFVSFYAQCWNLLSQAHLQFRFTSVLRTASSVLQIIPAIAIANLTHNPFLINLWSVLIGLLQLSVFVWHSRRHYRLGLELRWASRARAREMAAYTGKTFATLLVGSFFGSVDRLVLGKLAPPDGLDFTRYNIASNAGQRIQGLSVAIMGPVFHNTSRAVGARGITSAAEVYNQTFDFTFGWYVLVAIWASLWHPVLLRLWLGRELGQAVEPVFAPLIIASCLTAIGSISVGQIGPLNRVGIGLIFNLVTGVLTGAGVYFGWRLGGVIGVAYGFLFSRAALVAQDLFVIRLIKGGGWLAGRTWLHLSAQCLIGAGFACFYLVFPRYSLWLMMPAAIHGSLVAAWLSRHQLRKVPAGIAWLRDLRCAPFPPAPEP